MYRKTMKNFAVIHWAHMIYETTRASLAGHTYYSHGDSQQLEYCRGQKLMDKMLSMCPQYYCAQGPQIIIFLDRVQELSHQNDRVVPILVANMLICL